MLKLLKNLSNNYLELLNDKEDFNVIINVGQFPNIKVYSAHSAILRYRSLHFRNELERTINDRNHIKTINFEQVSVQQFEIIIKYIYGGVVSLETLDAPFIFELMLVAYEFLFEELAKHLETYLIEERAQWLNSHFVLVYQKSLNNKLQELQNWCYDIATKYPDLVFNSDDFTSIQENALVSLIIRDDLQIDEGKIWNYVIKWGIAQNPGLSLDPENWSYDDFITVKNTLKNCLPLIRYFQMSNEDIINNVQRYQQLFERNLWLDIMKKFMASDQPITSIILPPRIKLTSQFITTNSIDIFSTVINDEHLSIIASWIDKLPTKYSVTEIPYDFKLLLRGSKNGFTAESFWNLCNNKTNVIIVMKVNDTNEILGGYNPIGWDMPDENSFYKSCNDCFLFSLNSCTNPISILSPVVKPEFAIYCNTSRGPCFSDLNMFENFNQDSGCCCFHGSFKEPIRNISLYEDDISFFSVEDYEVFQIRTKTLL